MSLFKEMIEVKEIYVTGRGKRHSLVVPSPVRFNDRDAYNHCAVAKELGITFHIEIPGYFCGERYEQMPKEVLQELTLLTAKLILEDEPEPSTDVKSAFTRHELKDQRTGKVYLEFKEDDPLSDVIRRLERVLSSAHEQPRRIGFSNS